MNLKSRNHNLKISSMRSTCPSTLRSKIWLTSLRVFKNIINKGKAVKLDLEKVQRRVEELVQWKKEFRDVPKKLPNMTYLEGQCNLITSIQWKEKTKDLENSASNAFLNFFDIHQDTKKIINEYKLASWLRRSR